jgi:methyl-galactoside transport system substrate-binding protein
MKSFKKILVVIVVAIMMTNVLFSYSKVVANSDLKDEGGRPVRASVLLHRADDPYIALVAQSFQEIQKKNEGKVVFTFYDCKGNQALQDQYIDSILNDETADVILLNLVDTSIYPEPAQLIINKIKEKNIPVVLFNREPLDINSVRSYNKAYFVGTNAAEAGVLQGKIIFNLWNKDKKNVDKNGDNIMQYVMIMGPRDNLEAIGRTKYSILTINDAGIKTQELALRVANWEEELAKEVMEPVFLQYSTRIEAIIANNDAMAIGAIEVLQKYGYNKGGKSKTIPVVGVDAIPEAQKLIKEGVMAGSVLQDAYGMAEATYDIGANLVYGRPPLEGTSYKFDDTGVSVRIPYKEYISNDNV